MWNKLGKAYTQLEDEQIAVLSDPAALQDIGPSCWRTSLVKMAQMTALEREDLLRYTIRYRGWRGLWPLLAFELVVNLAALMFYWVLPTSARSVWPLLGLVSVGAVFLYLACIMSWFMYRDLVIDRSDPWRTPRRLLGFAGATALTLLVIDVSHGKTIDAAYVRYLFGIGFWSLAAASPIYLIAIARNFRFERINEERGIIERDRLAHELSQSQLRLLRAQIEPHFLFNTLGAVQQLAEQGAPRAAELTANLIAFLRSSFTDMRTDQVTLRSDFGLIDAYLKVMQARMGTRLRFTLDLPEDLAEVKVPAMLILTLVENAIKHGIEPALRGGEVAVSARCVPGSLHIEVRDTGAGTEAPQVFGEGLSNLKKRLTLTYGADAASLAFTSPDEGGVIATLILPMSAACPPKS